MKNPALSFISQLCCLVFISISLPAYPQDKQYAYNDPWGCQGLSIESVKNNSIEIVFSIHSFGITSENKKGTIWQIINTPGLFLPSEPGQPELPSYSRFLAIPKEATPSFRVIESRSEIIKDVHIIPSHKIAFDSQPADTIFKKDKSVYEKNSFFPLEPVMMSSVSQIRGIDVVMLGVFPFQYNPVTKELKVIRDIRLEISYENGKSYSSEDRYRNFWWDQVLDDIILNFNSLPSQDYSKNYESKEEQTGCDYLIIVPDHNDFIAWADTIKKFRTEQGILTEVKTITEVGGNTSEAIKNYIHNAYLSWDIPPTAVLLLADYCNEGEAGGITSPGYFHPIGGTYITDNSYADVNNDFLPDIVLARITARNENELQLMVRKFIQYESNPPTNPGFYKNPVTALGWQTDRWFQICSETIGGFWKKKLNKTPVRINAIYNGSPEYYWSTATSTNSVLNYFGPLGLNYIPQFPILLGGWDGGSPSDISNAIHNGAFMVMHRDHGEEQKWGEPLYSNTNIEQLSNNDLSFILSINCLNGRFDYEQESFAEKFHRHSFNGNKAGALGITAASQVSYSFVNDVFAWGLIDNMWPDFLNDYGSPSVNPFILPSFGNLAGKYFLQQSSWPYNPNMKIITYEIFHHHGDAFLNVFSETPGQQFVISPDILIQGCDSINIHAESGSYIALSYTDNQYHETHLLSSFYSSGSAVNLGLDNLPPDITNVLLTSTKQNYIRYHKNIPIVNGNEPVVIIEDSSIDDENEYSNGNGLIDCGESFYLNLTVKNIGNAVAKDLNLQIACNDPHVISISDSPVNGIGNLNPGQSASTNQNFFIVLDRFISDQYIITFDINLQYNDSLSFVFQYSIRVNAPDFLMAGLIIDDAANGNNNGILDPDESARLTVSVQNTGHLVASSPNASLQSNSPYLTILNIESVCDSIPAGAFRNFYFDVITHENIPYNSALELAFNIHNNIDPSFPFSIRIGTPNDISIGTDSLILLQYPFFNYFKANRSQILIKGNELGIDSAICSGISFDFQNISPPGFQQLPNFLIRIKPTSLNELSGSFFNMESADTLIFKNPFTLPFISGLNKFDTSPFKLNSSNNYIIDISWGRSDTQTNNTFAVYGTSYPEDRVVYGFSDNAFYPAYPDYSGSSNICPNIKFHYGQLNGNEEKLLNISVLNRVMGTPINNAQVKIGSKIMQTDQQGHTQYSLFPGNYLALATHPDYRIPEEMTNLLLMNDNQNLVFYLLPDYSANFIIKDIYNNVIDNATITINGNSYQEGECLIRNLYPGPFYYTVSCPFYYSQSGLLSLYDEIQVKVPVELIADGTNSGSIIKNNIGIWPNPTKGTITIKSPDDHYLTAIEVYNLSGLLIARREFMNNENPEVISIDITNQANGIYFIRLLSKQDTCVFKMIKQ